jgi:NADP-dependent 3-hydroxy acid dehydrogenase YdfG
MFSIYPNPVDELLNLSISTDLAIDSGSVEVYDVLGRKMIQREVSFANGNTQQIDVSELNAGIYIVQMSFNSKTYSSRIIKM